MSKTKGKGSSGTGTSSAAETFNPVIPPTYGTDQSFLPFPEWTDQSLNAEKWDKPKVKTPNTTATSTEEDDQFRDPQIVKIPNSLTDLFCSWKRPSEAFPEGKMIMFAEKPEYPDLTTNSKHLLHSDFVRSFISAIVNLEYLGNVNPPPIEYTTVTFTPTTQDIPWRPWHHIYSMCKAGKGQKHNPQVNQLGKYVVRLFWMGSWRKILIDDLLPVGIGGYVLLPGMKQPVEEKKEVDPLSLPATPPPTPVSDGKGGKKKEGKGPPQPPPNEIEIWPYLLCKALLKIASLTWTEKNELVDFDIVHCLTGWVPVINDLRGMNLRDKWEMCKGFTNHYDYDSLQPKGKGGKGGKEKAKKDKTPKSSKASKASGKTTAVEEEADEEEDLTVPCHTFITCTNMRDFPEDKAPNLSPCWSHNILLDQTRMTPLMKPLPQQELESWKKWRWVQWAAKKGIYDPPEDYDLIKYVKIVSAFKKVHHHFVPSPPSYVSLKVKPPEVEEDKGKKGKGKGKEKDDKKAAKSDKSSKTSKGSAKKGKGDKFVPPPDPSLWGDFFQLWEYMDTISIYYKPSRFITNFRISDLTCSLPPKEAPKKDKKGKAAGPATPAPTYLTWNKDLLPSRNQPLFIFTDSLDYKLFVINIVQPGNISLIYPTIITEEIEKSTKSYAHASLEHYDWTDIKIGNILTFVNTEGISSSITNVEKGRHLFRLWIQSDNSFVLNILSDIPAVIGNWEKVQHFMQDESQRFTKFCHDVSRAYGELIQSFGLNEFRNGLSTFYSSYKPDQPHPKRSSIKVHERMLQEILKMAKDNYNVQDYKKLIFAFKVLFINPNIVRREDHPEKPPTLCPDSISFVYALSKKVERAATKIQAFFKRVLVQKLMAYHNQNHQKYLIIFNTLKKFYSDFFSVSKRFSFCSYMLRNLLFGDEKNEWNKYYSLYQDLKLVVHSQCIGGNSNQKDDTSWVYITRATFYCNCPDSIVANIQLFSLLPHFVVRVFNNDTQEEMTRFANNVNVQYYVNNANGYTVLCYGWSQQVIESTNWKLCFITVKKKETTRIILNDIKPIIKLLRGVFIPSAANKILRYKIEIVGSTMVSFRLSVSCPTAKIVLKLLDENNRVLDEISDFGNVIYPSKILFYEPPPKISNFIKSLEEVLTDRKKSSKSVTYLYTKKEKSSTLTSVILTPSREVKHPISFYIEGYVLDKSWPLTIEEWNVVEQARQMKYTNYELFSTSESQFNDRVVRRPSRIKSKQSSNTTMSSIFGKLPPYWILYYIGEDPESLLITVDKAREEEIKNIKRTWIMEDPDRAKKAAILREEYLAKWKLSNEEEESLEGLQITEYGYDVDSKASVVKLKSGLIAKDTASEDYKDHITSVSLIYENYDYDGYDNNNNNSTEKSYDYEEKSISEEVLTEELIKNVFDEIEGEILQFVDSYTFELNAISYLISEQKNRREFMKVVFAAMREESLELMKDVFTQRQRFIDWLIREEESKAPPPPPPTDPKKQDKNKKKK